MKSKGSALIEYGLLLAVIIIAMLFMSLYVRRAVLGRIHEDSERIGARYDYGGETVSNTVISFSRDITTNVSYWTLKVDDEAGEELEYDIWRTTSNIHKDDTHRTVNEQILY